MMKLAGLSLLLPPGLNDSSLANSRTGTSSRMRVSSISGVCPTVARIPMFIFTSLGRRPVVFLDDLPVKKMDRAGSELRVALIVGHHADGCSALVQVD